MTAVMTAPPEQDAKRTCSFCSRSKHPHEVEMVPFATQFKDASGAGSRLYFCPCCDRTPDGPIGKFSSSNAQHPGWKEIADEDYDDSAPDGPVEGPSGPHELS